MVISLFTIVPFTASAASEISYIDENGEPATEQANPINIYNTLLPGWYMVNSNYTFDTTLTVQPDGNDRDINIILCDGAALTLGGSYDGLTDNGNVNLNFYAQSGGTGKVILNSVIALNNDDSTLNIYGGRFIVPQDSDAYIYSNGGVTINGGSLENCEIQSYTNMIINGGSIDAPAVVSTNQLTINGGTVNCTEYIGADEIILNLGKASEWIKSDYYDGSVSVAQYAALVDEDGNEYTGAISNTDEIAGIKLYGKAHIHSFGDAVWTWDGFVSATAEIECAECHSKYSAKATSENGGLTVDATGEHYTATVTLEGTEYTSTKERNIHEGDPHSYDVTWKWDGYESATATAICSVCEEKVTAEGTITSVRTDPTPGEDGSIVYTATATIDGTPCQDIRSVTIPRLGTAYLALDGTVQYATANRIEGASTEDFVQSPVLDGSSQEWYAICESIELNERISCNGNINLILCDGVTLTAHKGITVPSGSSLTIWTQSDGDNAGSLIVDNPDVTNPGIGNIQTSGFGDITINGGILDIKGYIAAIGGITTALTGSSITINRGDVTANCDRYVGIGSGYGDLDITINGGTVHANGGSNHAAIGVDEPTTCDIWINGGNVYANEGINDSRVGIGSVANSSATYIVLKWKNYTDSIYANSYSGHVTLGSRFTDEDDNFYRKGVLSDLSTIADVTLLPPCAHDNCTGPVWEWYSVGDGIENYKARATFVCNQCMRDVVVDATRYSTTNSGFGIKRTAKINFNDMTYTDTGSQVFGKDLELYVSGVRISSDNYTDVLGDGKVSYDVDTNTLTLNNAEIEVAANNDSYSSGIYCNEGFDLPLTICLTGNSIIKDETYDSCNHINGIRMAVNAALGYVITGGGTLDISLDSSSVNSNHEFGGMIFGNSVTIDDASRVNVSILGPRTAKGVQLNYEDTDLKLKGGSELDIYVQSSSNASYAVYGNIGQYLGLSISANSVLDARCGNRVFGDNIAYSTYDVSRGGWYSTSSSMLNAQKLTDSLDPLKNCRSAYLPYKPFIFAGHTVSLDDDIAVNYYMLLGDEVTSQENAQMQFYVPDTSSEYMNQNVAVSAAGQNSGYYVFKCRVAAKDMDSQIQAKLVYGGNESDVQTYSVREYAQYLIDHQNEKPSYVDAAPLAEAMLNYGDYAHNYFSSEAALEDIDINIPEKGYTENLPAGVSFDGATLSLKSKTSLSLYFISASDIELTMEGKTAGVDYDIDHSGNEYVIRIRNISAAKLNDNFTVTVTSNGQSGTVTYSPMTYCYKAQTSSNAKLANVVKALYLYWLEADEYFNKNQGGN